MDEERKFITTRILTRDECPWLGDEIILSGTVLTEASDRYGCCSPSGIFVTYAGMVCPTQVPKSAVEPIEDICRQEELN